MKSKLIICILGLGLLFSACNKKELAMLRGQNATLTSQIASLTAERDLLNEQLGKMKNDYSLTVQQRDQGQKDCESRIAAISAQIDDYKNQIKYLKENGTQVLGRLQDMAVISTDQAKSVKQSLDKLGEKEDYIQQLHNDVARRDSMLMNLALNLKSSLSDVNDSDVNIKVEKNVVFIALSDKMLFKSGQYTVSPQARVVLGKVAKILNARPNLSILVEGNTDNVPIKTSDLADNWDLSVKRATSVVRILQSDFGVAPSRMTAGGRSEFAPLQPNENSAERALNRRTRIVIQPELDQFFKLVEKS